MISNIIRTDGRLIGEFRSYISFEALVNKSHIEEIKEIITNQLFEELAREDTSGLFTYKILNIIYHEDLFGYMFDVTFEFIQNKVLVEQLKIVSERLETGL
jgi:hypothetical protein